MKTEFVHKSMIQPGDCIMVKGVPHTTGKNDFRTGFMGLTIFGDSYRMGMDKVERCLFPKWRNGEIIGYYAQING